MNTLLPPIYRDCRRLLVHTEEAVRRFARYHKYTVGADLRRLAMAVMRAAAELLSSLETYGTSLLLARVHRALFDKARQAEQLLEALHAWLLLQINVHERKSP